MKFSKDAPDIGGGNRRNIEVSAGCLGHQAGEQSADSFGSSRRVVLGVFENQQVRLEDVYEGGNSLPGARGLLRARGTSSPVDETVRCLGADHWIEAELSLGLD